jgi:hypothetical protein
MQAVLSSISPASQGGSTAGHRRHLPAHRSVPPVAREFIDGFKAHVAGFLRRGPWR